MRKENILALSGQAHRLGDSYRATPPIGKELPMDTAATLTAVLAIISFGFIAAVILGMI
ncbi:MAG: hypothetical protein AB7V40_00975 [Methyloceanibacter sp.]